MKNLENSKWDRVDEEVDGKRELDMGVEELEKEELDGGIGDGSSESDFDPKEFAMGVEVEMEHTNDTEKAKDIVKDHLTEDPKYYTKLKTIEKTDLTSRWEKIKKALKADEAFMDMAAEAKPDEEEQSPEEEAAPEEQPQEEQPQEEAPEEQPQEAAPEEQPQEEAPEEEAAPEEEEQPSDEESIQVLKDHGYSDQAISYIMHGHTPPQPTKDDHAANNELLDGEQDREYDKQAQESKQAHIDRMNELEHSKQQAEMPDQQAEQSHRQRMMDLEYEHARGDGEAGQMDRGHKQKILALAYKKAQLEMEIEIEHKKAEMKLKLQQSANKAEQKKAMDSEKHKHQLKEQKKSMTADHNVTSKAEQEGK
jgi:hypothetical protein